MRIAVVSPYDLSQVGGVQQVAIELSRRLRLSGDDVVLVGPGVPPRDLGGRSVGPSRSVRANRSTVPLSVDLRAVGATRAALRDADVVHVHEPFVPVVGWAAVTSGRPRVATFHADPARWTRITYRVGAPIGKRLLSGAVVTAASRVAADTLAPSWSQPVIVPNGIDHDSYRIDVPRHPRRVVFLGRDDPRKGRAVMLEAWESIRRSRPDAELVVVGSSGSDRDGVRFAGRVGEEEKRSILASSGVYAAPNLGGESFGIVVAEAMAAGCAVVASNLPAFRAVVGDDGRLVPPGDPAALAAAVGALLDDPATATALGERARRAVARFDWDNVVEAYRRAYESAIAAGGSTIETRKE